MLRQCKRTRVKAPELNSSPSKSSLVPANTNEGLILKPAEGPNVRYLGRTKPDTDKDGQDNFVRRKVPFTISTFNTRTLNSPAKKEELAYEALQYRIDILCLQEHRIANSDVPLQESLNGYTLITS